jgi:hypothetical protein
MDQVFDNFSTRFIVVAYSGQRTAIHSRTVKASIMNLSSLNVDVHVNFFLFVEAVDRFNLALSGILKGFENVNTGINLRKRYSKDFPYDVKW